MAKASIEIQLHIDELLAKLSRVGLDFAEWCLVNSPYEINQSDGCKDVCTFCSSLPGDAHEADCLWARAVEMGAIGGTND